MRVLIALNHPAHYFLFKYVMQSLKEKGHVVDVVIKEKDILEKILISERQDYIKINEKKQRRNNPFSVISKGLIELIKQDVNLYRFVKRKNNRPDFMLGTDISIAHVGKWLGIPSFVYNEDDFEINKLFCKATYPFANYILSPEYTSVGKFDSKKIGYNSIQKMSYLNPKYFQANENVLNELRLSKDDPYFIIRLVSLTSGHDIEGKHSGIDNQLLLKIINFLKPKGKVFITSEDSLTEDLSKYQLKIKPNQMHNIMAYATLFIGDSQSMCAEAGILGTPFIRFNDFVGKIQYLNELENKYKMGWGVKTNEPERVFEIIEKLLRRKDIKDIWAEKRKKLFNEKSDLNALTVWMLENYPESVKKLQTDKNFQYNLK